MGFPNISFNFVRVRPLAPTGIMTSEPITAIGTTGAPEMDGQLLVARGGRWYHRPGCLLLEGKTTEHITPHEADFRGLTPCRLCDPVMPARPVGSPTDVTEVIEGSRPDLGR